MRDGNQGFELCRAPEAIDSVKPRHQLVPTREIRLDEQLPLASPVASKRDLMLLKL
jgi:hypothetical protein